MTIATYLDPRFKKMYISPDDLVSVEGKIAREMDLALLSAESVAAGTSTVTNPARQHRQAHDSLWGSHDEVLVVNSGRGSTAAESIMALQLFNRESVVPRKTDPLKWWNSRNMGSQKYLYEVAMKFMSVPATSVPSERVFSKAGQLITERQNRLSGKNIDMLLFLNSQI